jgi:LemA protein
MNGAWIGVAIVLGVVILLGMIVAGIYNRLVTLRNLFKNAFAQIDVQLQRRHDLIPNLVEASKAYLQHESGTLEKVIAARNQAVAARGAAAANPADATAVQGLLGAESALTGAMGRLFAVMEAYPNLKADQTIARLTEELTSTENRVAFARQAYNDAVMQYNTARETFPNVLFAGLFQFQPAVLFDIANPETREAPKVSFK